MPSLQKLHVTKTSHLPNNFYYFFLSFTRDLPPGPGAGAYYEREAPHQCQPFPKRGHRKTTLTRQSRPEEALTQGHGEESKQHEGEDELRQQGQCEGFPEEELVRFVHHRCRGSG